jgi:hypothetical protein
MHNSWSKSFLEAGKKRLSGDIYTLDQYLIDNSFST